MLIAAGLVAIETAEVGDTVISTDPETGETAEKDVVEVYINQSSELIHLTVDGEEITTKPAHPFYVPEKGWTSAIELRAGDVLVLVNGEYVTVEAVPHAGWQTCEKRGSGGDVRGHIFVDDVPYNR